MEATLVSSMEAALVSNSFRVVLVPSIYSLREEFPRLSDIQTELEKLESASSRIQSVLLDAMDQKLEGHQVQDWFGKLTNLANNVDNILDKFNFEAKRRKQVARICHVEEVRDFFSRNNCLIFRLLMAHNIKWINGEMNSFAREAGMFNLGQTSLQRSPIIEEERVTGSFIFSTIVVGRHEERERLMGALLGGNNFRKIRVVSIIGIGGIGKTTLAQLIYNDERVDEHFNLKIWVCVSEEFILSRLLKSILELVTKKPCQISQLDNLQREVREALVGKRFLLVLDDVWNEEREKWENLERLLNSGAHGSTIMVTTRNTKVSSIMGSGCSALDLQLVPLSDDLCFDLFMQRAFESGVVPSENLKAIGKEIVKKCRGLPLAAKALGSALRFKRRESEWKRVLESETWEILDLKRGAEVMPALKLSYDHLSAQSKQCYAFCSLFPKDYEMDKERLVHQWMCNGFVQNEQIGFEVFTDLLWRSFFSEAKIDRNGTIATCKMHDLMHDLARLVAGKHFCLLAKDTNNGNICKTTHHLLVNNHRTLGIADALKKAQSLRTLLLLLEFDNPINHGIICKIFLHSRHVRVLDLSSTGINTLPNSLGGLIHLRYLDLSKNSIEKLPKSISYLLNLQVMTLKLNNKLRKLPKNLKNLRSLRHLDIRGCNFLTSMPIGLGKLTNLITLTDFTVSKEKYSCGLEELHTLRISRELFIWQLENFKPKNLDKEAVLINKENLNTLRLTWDHRNSIPISNDDFERTLEVLRPPSNLEILQIHNYGALKFPTWLDNSLLPNLVEVKFTYCTKCEELPSFGSILSLKSLELIGMHEVKQIGVKFYGTGPIKGFPCLEKLSFFDMPKLEEWSILEGAELFSRLITLTLGKCPSLNSIPRIPNIQSLDLSQCSAPLMESLPYLATLSSLLIEKILGLTSLSNGSLSNFGSLRKLNISSCMQLKNLPLDDLEQLISLQSLDIVGCPQLDSLSFNSMHLTSLRFLNLRYCTGLNSLPKNLNKVAGLRSFKVIGCRNIISWSEQVINGLSILNDFTIMICNNQVNLSGWLHHLTNLSTLIFRGGHEILRPAPDSFISGNSLTICCCGDQLGSLLNGLSVVSSLEHLTLDGISGSILPNSIGEIKSLRNLVIIQCTGIASLPGSIRGLRRLEWFNISGCPELENRCQRDVGEDWNIISHVEMVCIGGQITERPSIERLV